MANYYFSIFIRLDANILGEEEKDQIINLFLEEEKYIEIQKNNKNPDPNFNEEEIVYKYLLSANVIANKDYNFDSKTTEQIIQDGKNSLKNIFLKIFKKFIFDFSEGIGGITKIPFLEEPISAEQDFLLNLIKYSTFIFSNNSIAKSNGNNEYIQSKLSSGPYKNSSEQSLRDSRYYKTFYCPPINYEFNAGDKKISNKEYSDPLENNFVNYFTTGGKFFNYGKNKDSKIDPIIFGEFYYTIKPEKLDNFYAIYQKIFIDNQIFDDFRYCFHSKPYFGTDNNTTINQKNFLYLSKLGYFSSFQENKPATWQESEKIEKSIYGNGLFTLTRKEVLKYYKFSFVELKKIIDGLKNKKEKFEDYFDLNFRINLNLTADLLVNNSNVQTSKQVDFDNHHIYELFNIPYASSDPLNIYPPFNYNILFNTQFLYEQSYKRRNVLYNKFEITDLEYKVYALEEDEEIPDEKKNIPISDLLPILYSNLLNSPSNTFNNLPVNNNLFKMLFSKEGVVITVDEYSSNKQKGNNKFKINYFKKIVDFKINSNDENIYFSPIDDAKEALFLIKKKYYKTILENIYNNNDIKRILDSYKFDDLKKDLEVQYSSIKKLNYIEEYEKSIKDIYKFYEEIKIAQGYNYGILIIRETAIKILDGQIKVLENG